MVTVRPGSGSGDAHSFAKAKPKKFCLPESQHTQEGQDGREGEGGQRGGGAVVGGARWAKYLRLPSCSEGFPTKMLETWKSNFWLHHEKSTLQSQN